MTSGARHFVECCPDMPIDSFPVACGKTSTKYTSSTRFVTCVACKKTRAFRQKAVLRSLLKEEAIESPSALFLREMDKLGRAASASLDQRVAKVIGGQK